jgi:hypothetical protein
MTTKIIPLPAPENQPRTGKSFSTFTPWKAIRAQLFKLIAQGQIDPISRQTMAIIFGPGMLGPENPALCEEGILYITGWKRRYLQRALRAFQSFHQSYYGYELKLPESFSPVELRTYRLVFCWERARKAFEAEKNNLHKNHESV